MLNKQEIKDLINTQKLIENYVDLETQLTPNGFDLTIGQISEFTSESSLDFTNKNRVLAQTKEIICDQNDWWQLKPGAYKVKTNETINMPNTLTALAYTRTSLLRSGVFTVNGVWDAGFCGKSEFLLVVQNPFGLKLQKNARVIQLVFISVTATESYNGVYKHLK